VDLHRPALTVVQQLARAPRLRLRLTSGRGAARCPCGDELLDPWPCGGSCSGNAGGFETYTVHLRLLARASAAIRVKRPLARAEMENALRVAPAHRRDQHRCSGDAPPPDRAPSHVRDTRSKSVGPARATPHPATGTPALPANATRADDLARPAGTGWRPCGPCTSSGTAEISATRKDPPRAA
jgi:hypothetical protein